MLPAKRQGWCRWVAAIALAVTALEGSRAEAAVADDAHALGLRPTVGEPAACITPGGVGSSTPMNPLSALALGSGDVVFVRWAGARWGLLWLSNDGRKLSRVRADVPTGGVTGAVRLADDRVLVAAEEGLFLLVESLVLFYAIEDAGGLRRRRRGLLG